MKLLKSVSIIFIFLISWKSNAQVQLSVYSEISIITVDSGDNLYESFGHSAIRLKDPVLNLDLVYNYGVFDFNAPNFYSNFIKGRLLYKLVRYNFSYFLEGYKKDKRWIKQQVLNLTQEEKQSFFLYLEKNAAPQNATYLYDPFFDNCASRLKDVTKEILKEKVTFVDEGIEKNLSFRTLMNREFHWNTWGSLGINLALGAKLDAKRNPIEYTYLPDYVYEIFKNSTINRDSGKVPLVKKEIVLADFPSSQKVNFLTSPFLIFSLLFILILVFSMRNKEKSYFKFLDGSLLILSGFIGIFILFLWFFTNHSMTPNNFNILWAFPFHLYVGFLLFRKRIKSWFPLYFKVSMVLLGILFFLWIIKIQVFSIALIPVFATLLLRFYFLQKSVLKNS